MGRALTALGALAALALLAACGGGGGGGGGGAPALPSNVSCTSAHLLRGNTCINPAQRTSLASAADSLNEWSNDPGFDTQPVLEQMKAHYAYGVNGVGFNGAGVTVALIADAIDASGVKLALQDADGNTRPVRISSITHNGATLNAGTIPLNCGQGDNTCLGSELAPLMVGKVLNAAVTNTANVRGVAPGAKILDIPYGYLQRDFCRSNPTCLDDATQAAAEAYVGLMGSAMNAALAHEDKPRYINLLYAHASDEGRYLPVYGQGETPTGNNLQFLQHMMATMGAAVWQGGAPASGEDTRSVFVVQAGGDYGYTTRRTCANFNDGSTRSCGPDGGQPADNPRIYGLLPRIAELVDTSGVPMGSDLAATFLTVVGLDSVPDNGQYPLLDAIDTDSNRCGDAKAWCLAAPSENIKVYGGRTVVNLGGGSAPLIIDRIRQAYAGVDYAAALVTGALALVDSAFNAEGDMVSPVAIRKRLLDTADKSGRYANQDEYGQGALDIEAALGPVGSSSMPTGASASFGPLGLVGSVQAPGLPLAGLTLALPGHALSMLGETKVMTLDSQGFPFFLQLRDLAHAPLGHASLFSDMAASTAAQGPATIARSESGALDISAGVGSGAAWGSALTPQHLAQGGQGNLAGQLAAGAHLAVSPLMASSLEAGDTGHVAVRASFGQQSIAAMACTQRHTQRGQDSVQGNGDNACMALGWDWHSDSFGLSVRAHALDSRGGLYRYGARCFGGSCAGGGATATELGLGGFAKLSQGLRLGWNYWHGWADDLDGGSDLVRYAGLGHSAGSIALEGASGSLESVCTATPSRRRQPAAGASRAARLRRQCLLRPPRPAP